MTGLARIDDVHRLDLGFFVRPARPLRQRSRPTADSARRKILTRARWTRR